jgi:cytochrome b
MKAPEATLARIRVWDAPVRVFHALLVFSFMGAYLTAESEHWRLVHITLGYTVGGLVAFRLLWGFLGTRYARFGNFVRKPATTLVYLKSLSGKIRFTMLGITLLVPLPFWRCSHWV